MPKVFAVYDIGIYKDIEKKRIFEKNRILSDFTMEEKKAKGFQKELFALKYADLKKNNPKGYFLTEAKDFRACYLFDGTKPEENNIAEEFSFIVKEKEL